MITWNTGTGDLMTVDSYTDVANQMDYEDIPTYTATKVDPDDPEPIGEFPLYETYDLVQELQILLVLVQHCPPWMR